MELVEGECGECALDVGLQGGTVSFLLEVRLIVNPVLEVSHLGDVLTVVHCLPLLLRSAADGQVLLDWLSGDASGCPVKVELEGWWLYGGGLYEGIS